jgi:hypothetical protein
VTMAVIPMLRYLEIILVVSMWVSYQAGVA